MGDRTYVEITIHKYYYNQLLSESFAGDEKKLEEEVGADDIDEGDDLVHFQCHEVNYATWDSLENLLREHNIEFNKLWAAGGDYEAGESWTRNVNGKYMEHELSDKGIAIQTYTNSLVANLDNPEKLKELILKMDAEVNPFEIKPLTQPQSIDFIKNA